MYNENVAIELHKLKGGNNMTQEPKIFITASELAGMLGISIGQAYKIIRKMNSELERTGFLIIAGKIPRRYFEKHWYGFST